MRFAPSRNHGDAESLSGRRRCRLGEFLPDRGQLIDFPLLILDDPLGNHTDLVVCGLLHCGLGSLDGHLVVGDREIDEAKIRILC